MVFNSDLSSSSPSSSSSVSPSKPIHSSSLVDPEQHSPYLMQLLGLDISKPVIDYIVDYVSHILGQSVDHSVDQPITLFPMTRGRSQSRRQPRPAGPASDVTTFVKRVLRKSRATMAEVLATLAYVNRARPYLQVSSDSKYPFERVFLGALIVASKFLNDSCLSNMYWAQCTRLFGKHDVGRIEREFLEVLDWELRLTEDDLLAHYEPLVLATFSDAPDAPLSESIVKLPRFQECPLIEEAEEELSSSPLPSFPSSAHQRSETNQPTRLPLIMHFSSPSSFSPRAPLPSPASALTPDLEFDGTNCSFDTDSNSSSSPPPLTPPSSLAAEVNEDRTKGSDSFWDTFFSSMRLQEASSPIARFQKRTNS
ncbi:hypothetical protein F5050DRAFT_1803364 [Lentinula boryana]|uniref:Cyclin N-terminal domain-containing protein n=1 Tax=Lentinula boryana TaxID=40481 RepID=A0ABQ8QS21_9AGAR|nr:hypothetical protein F5050DRAFT_1803364 [Lentinula boryana]